jgi:uncharacterized RDD family membrane protein YckC
MQDQIQIHRNGEDLGLYSMEEIHLLLGDGTLRLNDLAWVAPGPDWKPLGRIPGMRRSSERYRPPPAVRSHESPRSQLARKQKRSGLRESRRYAGLLIRVVALFIDGMILGMLGFALDAVLIAPSHDPLALFRGADGKIEVPWTLALALAVFPWLYHAVAEATPWQGTPGKRLLGLKVIGPTGRRASFFRTLPRFVAKLISLAALGLGGFMILGNHRRQALHDRIVGTRVVHDV